MAADLLQFGFQVTDRGPQMGGQVRDAGAEGSQAAGTFGFQARREASEYEGTVSGGWAALKQVSDGR
jgi:hypothetical protein